LDLSYPQLCFGDFLPRATLAMPVCALDEFYYCTTVVFVPKATDGVLELCTRTNLITFSCDEVPMTKSFLYRAELGMLSRTGAVKDEVWQIFSVNSQNSYWLQISKLYFNGEIATSSSQSSLDSTMSMVMLRQCSLDNCVGCKDLNVQRLCYNALQCQLARCIGTLVHQQRPLCAIGMHLQSLVSTQLAVLEGAWLVISETMVTLITVAEGFDPPRSINWPDQAFYGFICASKDVSATAISIAVSSVNGIVQAIVNDPATNLRQQWTNDAMAQYTMTLAATTNFLNQVALAPLYGMIAVQKTFICSANSVISIISPTAVTIGDPSIQNYSSRGAGQCMSQYFTENMQGDGSGTDNALSIMNGVVQNMQTTSLQLGLEMLIHPMDATFTWLQGCISGLQDVVQSADREHCKLPNFAVQHSFHCACNDDSYKVADTRISETWMNSAFWCSTTMSMLQPDGSTKYIWNPYSLQQLKGFLRTTLDPYLHCVATGTHCDMPSVPIFDEQQVRISPSMYILCPMDRFPYQSYPLSCHLSYMLLLA
jgi:hypothetical protein